MSRKEEHLWAVSVGSALCPECAETPAEERRPSVWQRFRFWLINGGKAPSTLVCPNGHEWVRSVGVVLFRGGTSTSRLVRVPRDLFRALLAERRMQPTPMTYLMAVGAGLLLGLILDLILGWRWWVVVAGFIVLVWLFFLASAFYGPHRDLSHRLLMIINPDRAAQVTRQRLEDALVSGSLAGFEVDNWDGDMSIGGWSGSPEPDSLTIRHGAHDQEAEWVEVTVHVGDAADTADHWITEELERRLIEAQFPLPHDPEIEAFQQRQQNIQQAESADWQPISFQVDHKQTPGHIARIGTHWVAFLEAEKLLIEMTGNRVEPDQVRLVRIVNLDRYQERGA